MANEVRYTYNGKEVGTLRKLVSDVVVLEDEWISSMNQHFGGFGYVRFLEYVKRQIRSECSDDITDAQAWMLLHHITNTGVPLILRDEEADEKSAPAKIMNSMASSVLGVGDSVMGTSAKMVQPLMGRKKAADDPETSELQE